MTMNKNIRTLCRALGACLSLPLAAAPAFAGTAGGVSPVMGQWNYWFWLGYFSNVGSRGNVVMLCLVIFCISIVVLMSATRKS